MKTAIVDTTIVNIGRLMFLFAVFPLVAARADWSAQTLTRYGQKEMNEVEGKIAVRGPKVRLDVSSPTEMSIIYDQNSKASTALVHAARIRLEGGFEEYRKRIPLCLPGQLEACFKKLKLKKTGTEKVDGEICDVYVRKAASTGKKDSGKYDLTIWKPIRWKEVPALKSLIVLEDGDRVETRFFQVSTKDVKPSLFVIPKGYVRAGGLEELMKGIQSFSKD